MVSAKMDTNKSGQDMIICLGAGKSQEMVITTAKGLGYTVVAVDKNPLAPGFKIADIAINKSTYDASAIIQYLNLLEGQYRCAGVINRSSGPPVVVAAKLSERFNIPGVPVNSANTIVNKNLLRQACLRYGIPHPKFYTRPVTEVGHTEELQFPIIVKPGLSLVGKSGITVVRSHANMDAAIKHAVGNTINGEIIFEEYLTGSDIALVSFVQNKKIYPICFLKELNSESDDGTISGCGFRTYPPSEDNALESSILELSQEIVDIFDINRSAFMASYRVDLSGGAKLIEIHLDLGGDLLIEKLFPHALPLDFITLAVEVAAGSTTPPKHIHVNPTAIFYKKGGDHVSERGAQVIIAESHHDLDNMIEDYWKDKE